MNLSDAQRFSRHIALPEFGPVGQQRIFDAVVALVATGDSGIGLETAAVYLGASGVRNFRVLVAEGAMVPTWLQTLKEAYPVAQIETTIVTTAGSAWSGALSGCTVAVRDSFADDSFTEACRRRAIAAVVVRGHEDSVDILSLRPSSQTIPSTVPSIPPSPRDLLLPPNAMNEASKVVAGTFAAAEVLWMLAGRSTSDASGSDSDEGIIRHLRVPFSSLTDLPETRNISWPPV
jgi:hypothetical protein